MVHHECFKGNLSAQNDSFKPKKGRIAFDLRDFKGNLSAQNDSFKPKKGRIAFVLRDCWASITPPDWRKEIPK